jgi:hypothetical protein
MVLKSPTEQTRTETPRHNRLRARRVEREEAKMEIAGNSIYLPEDIALMKTVLEEAATILPVARRTCAMKAKLAARILASAAKGERDPIQLRIAALLEPADE